MPTNPVPNVLVSAGFLLWAPIGTAVPTNTVLGGVFTDAWPAAWLELGATDEGKTFSYEISVEPIEVAEFLDPVRFETVSRQGSMAFALADYTLTNVQKVMNGGTLAVTGVAPNELSTFTPPDPGEEVRAMIGFESLDNTFRLVLHQTINGSTIESQFQKPPQKALLPAEFQMEIPVGSTAPFSMYAVSALRG